MWKTRNVVQSQKDLVHHAVAMETEVHDRKWSFGIGHSSSVITNLSRKTTSAITDLLLFTTKSANAIKTLLDMTATSVSLATMTMTVRRKKALTRKNFLKLSAEEKDQYIRYINMSRHYISDYVVTLTPYSEEVNKTVKSNRDPTALNLSQRQQLWLVRVNALLCCTRHQHNMTRADIAFAHDGQGFPTWHRLYMLAWGKNPCRKSVTMKNFALPYWDNRK